MSAEGWLADTRTSYDTLATTYAERTRDLLSRTPYERAALALFADQVREAGDGPVADVGCGTGRITAHLNGLGLDVFGVDLSPAMVAEARRAYPALRFEVGSMTELDLPDASLAGLLAWYSLIHIPDEELGGVLSRFRRMVRPGGPLLVAFHVGDGAELKTRGFDGLPINVHVHKRRPDGLAARLDAAGFEVEAQTTLRSAESSLGGMLFAHRRP
ncbi:class I SAM-dependent DNA methyltransferase [Streptacidiphilus jiangxiensis]|uniref:Methyltransferase domain-containing protein n=1 Tax=Streptacidiphilus jiangxiensis TaxID=235985 RepID=A0A1H8BL89_STRJI|nr:class I SAM-dependent methyltransferase [Streptacidiphilus jiangxiensis]SEM83625.1 Methyltransferase domain-containing protein [Streptacidiphilus jiangxiensis]